MTPVRSSPLVSVVMPAYNCAAYIAAAIESVLGQSYRPLEIIVADDGSIDRTHEVVATYPEVIYLRQANGGPSRARNAGIRRARGEYVAFLDADDLWPPDKLAEQVMFLQTHPEVALLFGNARRFADDGWTEPPLFERYGFTSSYFGHDHLVTKAVVKLLEANFIPTGTVMARTHALFDAGLFDERFNRAEDWDLWLRLAIRYPIAYSRKLWKLKRVRQDALSNDTEAMTEAALAVVEKLHRKPAAGWTGLGADLARRLAAGYRNLGYLYLRQCRLADARRALRASLAHGLHTRALVYWATTFLGPRLVGAIIRLRG
jgi:glycosyltransferase involved in cell wall biosynthesis